ncbi:MAG: winged helix-turn-helix transcriptional regulator [Chloroflexi bacterium]|nr:winged helix-turn-helix transcriptional regulator [Chloroflexota bacterium]
MKATTLDVKKCLEIERTCSLHNLRKASRAVTQLYDDAFRPLRLHSTQLTLLVALLGAGETPITPLARALAMDRTTLARNLRPLERQGLVEIASGEDQRTRMVRLTAKGRQTVAQALPLWEQAQKQVIEHLGQERWHRLLEDLSRLVSMVNTR